MVAVVIIFGSATLINISALLYAVTRWSDRLSTAASVLRASASL